MGGTWGRSHPPAPLKPRTNSQAPGNGSLRRPRSLPSLRHTRGREEGRRRTQRETLRQRRLPQAARVCCNQHFARYTDVPGNSTKIIPKTDCNTSSPTEKIKIIITISRVNGKNTMRCSEELTPGVASSLQKGSHKVLGERSTDTEMQWRWRPGTSSCVPAAPPAHTRCRSGP